MMKRRTALLGAGLAALPWAWPLRAAAMSNDRAPIRIGQSAPISGPLASVGVAFRDTALAVFKEVNAQGGINGREIQLVTLDDEDRAHADPRTPPRRTRRGARADLRGRSRQRAKKACGRARGSPQARWST